MLLPITWIEVSLVVYLLIMWASLLFGGFVVGRLNVEQTHRISRPMRLTSSFMLVMGAWLWFIIAQGTQASDLSLWFAIGMTFSFLGDVFMAEVVPVDNHVLYGMLVSGIGHLAYIFGMLRTSLTLNITLVNLWLLVIWWLLVFFAWYFVIFYKRDLQSLQYFALPYAILLATTVGVAMGIAVIQPVFWVITIGAGLFLFSDLILAAHLFNNLKFKSIGDVVWLTHGPGQLLIVFGMAIAAIVQLVTQS